MQRPLDESISYAVMESQGDTRIRDVLGLGIRILRGNFETVVLALDTINSRLEAVDIEARSVDSPGYTDISKK